MSDVIPQPHRNAPLSRVRDCLAAVLRPAPLLTAAAIFLSASSTHALSQLDSLVEEVILQTTAEYEDIVLGQKAQDNRFILTPDSCFFFPTGPKLTGATASVIPGADLNSNQTFATVNNIKNAGQKIVWPLMPAQTGAVSVDVFFETATPGAELIVRLGDLTQTVITTASDGTAAQPWSLTANITQAGVTEAAIQDLEIELVDLHGVAEAGEIHKIEINGAALLNGYLLRTRWRPWAVHGSLRSSSLNASGLGHTLYVVEMRPDFSEAEDLSFYAPVTTKFGYYGVTYTPAGTAADHEFNVNGAANFSMWSYGANAPQPPVPERSHLLSVGNGAQIFDGYGHEGSGVKPRNGNPLAGQLLSNLVLALRMEPHVVDDEYRYRTYIGYYWDAVAGEWKHYASGRDYLDDQELASEGAGFAAPNSFVEVPGGVTTQRTGQIKRILDYRGWIKDDAGTWHAIDLLNGSPNTSNVRSKDWSTSADGWLRMKMGGIVHRHWLQNSVQRQITPVATLPAFMDPAKLAALDTKPVTVELHRAMAAFDGELKVNFTLTGLTAPAEVKLYHGDEDGMTLIYENGAFPDEWDSVTSLGTFGAGSHSVSLPATGMPAEGFCRILVEANSQGRYWSPETGHWLPVAFTNVDPDATAGAAAGVITVTNPASRPTAYSITSGNDDALFSLAGATGALTMAADLPDPPASSYRLEVDADLDGFSSWRNTVDVYVVPETDLLVQESFDAGTPALALAGSIGGTGWSGPWTGDSSWVFGSADTAFPGITSAGLKVHVGNQGTAVTRSFQSAVTVGDGAGELSDAWVAAVIEIAAPIAIGHSVRLELMQGATQVGYFGKKVNGSLGFELGESAWQVLSGGIGSTAGTLGTWHFALHLEADGAGGVGATLYAAEAGESFTAGNAASYPHQVSTMLVGPVTVDGVRLRRHNNSTSAIDEINVAQSYEAILIDSDNDGDPDVTDPDDDNDGMPDIDEVAYGLNPYSPADALLDGDDDGFSNLYEVIFGSDPTDGASRLGHLTFISNAQEEFEFTLSGKSGRSYSLWRTTTLETGSWTEIDSSGGALLSDSIVTLTDPAPPIGRAFYYFSAWIPEE